MSRFLPKVLLSNLLEAMVIIIVSCCVLIIINNWIDEVVLCCRRIMEALFKTDSWFMSNFFWWIFFSVHSSTHKCMESSTRLYVLANPLTIESRIWFFWSVRKQLPKVENSAICFTFCHLLEVLLSTLVLLQQRKYCLLKRYSTANGKGKSLIWLPGKSWSRVISRHQMLFW